jgi:hypothetical protein
MRMKIPALAALALCLLAVPAQADLEYAFNVTSASGALQPFSFSFTSPTFLAVNDVPTFSPFTVTDGVDSWTFAQGLASENVDGCFEFGTVPGSTLDPTCVIAFDGAAQSAAMIVQLFVPLPTATGVYDFSFGFFLASAGPFEFTGSLDITSVPEPASIGLFVIMLALVGWKLSQRRAHAHCDGKA